MGKLTVAEIRQRAEERKRNQQGTPTPPRRPVSPEAATAAAAARLAAMSASQQWHQPEQPANDGGAPNRYPYARNRSPAVPAAARAGMDAEVLRRCERVVDAMLAKPGAEAFSRPVDRLQWPQWYETVKKPMDLGTVKAQLAAYATVDAFLADVRLVFLNIVAHMDPGEAIVGLAQRFMSQTDRFSRTWLAPGAVRRIPLEHMDDDICHVCHVDEDRDENMLLECENCDVLCHQNCVDCTLDAARGEAHLTAHRTGEHWMCLHCAPASPQAVQTLGEERSTNLRYASSDVSYHVDSNTSFGSSVGTLSPPVAGPEPADTPSAIHALPSPAAVAAAAGTSASPSTSGSVSAAFKTAETAINQSLESAAIKAAGKIGEFSSSASKIATYLTGGDMLPPHASEDGAGLGEQMGGPDRAVMPAAVATAVDKPASASTLGTQPETGGRGRGRGRERAVLSNQARVGTGVQRAGGGGEGEGGGEGVLSRAEQLLFTISSPQSAALSPTSSSYAKSVASYASASAGASEVSELVAVDRFNFDGSTDDDADDPFAKGSAGYAGSAGSDDDDPFAIGSAGSAGSDDDDPFEPLPPCPPAPLLTALTEGRGSTGGRGGRGADPSFADDAQQPPSSTGEERPPLPPSAAPPSSPPPVPAPPPDADGRLSASSLRSSGSRDRPNPVLSPRRLLSPKSDQAEAQPASGPVLSPEGLSRSPQESALSDIERVYRDSVRPLLSSVANGRSPYAREDEEVGVPNGRSLFDAEDEDDADDPVARAQRLLATMGSPAKVIPPEFDLGSETSGDDEPAEVPTNSVPKAALSFQEMLERDVLAKKQRDAAPPKATPPAAGARARQNVPNGGPETGGSARNPHPVTKIPSAGGSRLPASVANRPQTRSPQFGSPHALSSGSPDSALANRILAADAQKEAKAAAEVEASADHERMLTPWRAKQHTMPIIRAGSPLAFRRSPSSPLSAQGAGFSSPTDLAWEPGRPTGPTLHSNPSEDHEKTLTPWRSQRKPRSQRRLSHAGEPEPEPEPEPDPESESELAQPAGMGSESPRSAQSYDGGALDAMLQRLEQVETQAAEDRRSHAVELSGVKAAVVASRLEARREREQLQEAHAAEVAALEENVKAANVLGSRERERAAALSHQLEQLAGLDSVSQLNLVKLKKELKAAQRSLSPRSPILRDVAESSSRPPLPPPPKPAPAGLKPPASKHDQVRKNRAEAASRLEKQAEARAIQLEQRLRVGERRAARAAAGAAERRNQSLQLRNHLFAPRKSPE